MDGIVPELRFCDSYRVKQQLGRFLRQRKDAGLSRRSLIILNLLVLGRDGRDVQLRRHVYDEIDQVVLGQQVPRRRRQQPLLIGAPGAVGRQERLLGQSPTIPPSPPI